MSLARTMGASARTRITRLLLSGALSLGNDRECPICGWVGFQFLPLKHPRVSHFDAICPRCGSDERARLAFLTMRPRLSGVARALHFAPERSLSPWLRSIVPHYVSADIEPGRADRVVDIMQIDFPDDSFDLVWCSHVLEHVPDDRRAIREMHRVTRPGGLCMVQVPLWHDVTDEDDSITDRQERVRRFFQKDHLRLYGYDMLDRLTEAGFSVDLIRPHHFPPETIFRHQIARVGNLEVFLCSKPPG
jgi:SAM-dependent methyltransferase